MTKNECLILIYILLDVKDNVMKVDQIKIKLQVEDLNSGVKSSDTECGFCSFLTM